VEAGQRLAGNLPHLQGALDALAVAGRQALGGDRVHLGQQGVHGGPADVGGLGIQRGAHLRVGGRHLVQSLKQRLEVQHGAAHQQRHAPRARISATRRSVSRTNSAAE
jgi:hypothetical protein